MDELELLEQKQCEQCKEIKSVKRFRKVANMYTSAHNMSMCKDCYSHNQAEYKRQAEARWEAGKEKREARRRQQEEWQKREAEREEHRRQWEDGREERERQQKEHQQKLDAWFSQQPDRECIACKQVLSAKAFSYSGTTDIVGEWLPTTLRKRCCECHETYRKGNRQVYPLCPMCNIPTRRHDFLREYQSYRLDLIKVCCENCIPQFNTLPENEQMVWLRSAMVAAYGETAYIYCLHYDGEDTSHNHIGRTKRLGIRLAEYRKNWHREFHHYHVLEELSFGPLSMERESRWMLHALKYHWPIDNFELLKLGEDRQGGWRQQAMLTETVQSFEPLTAPFETIEPFLRHDFGNTCDAHIAHWFVETLFPISRVQ